MIETERLFLREMTKNKLGLKRSTVALLPHDPAWEEEARRTANRLRAVFGEAAVDIRHVGSTSVRSIYAKPIIDIAVGVRRFEDALALRPALEKAGFYYRDSRIDGQLLFACGSFYDGTGDLQTHFIHVVLHGGKAWQDYLLFRDHLNRTPEAAKEYENLKLRLARECPVDSGRERYLAGKHDFIAKTLRAALIGAYAGKTVKIKTDRPIGYIHKKENYTLVYPVNYGYIPGVYGGDGEELDVYLLGVTEPVDEYECTIIGAAVRGNDCEDKLIGAPAGVTFTENEIYEQIKFQEQWYDTEIKVFR